MASNISLEVAVESANTGLDAIQRAPIVDRDTGIKCIRIQDISQNKQYSDWGFTDVTENNYERFQLRKNDILIARTGASIGVNKYINKDLNAVYNNGLIRIRVDEVHYYPKFIYYLLQSQNFKDHIYSIAFATAAQPNMKIRDFLRYEIPVMSLNDQKYIASFLSQLDDKIELNRQMNATLEAIAQALFKSWFVDFDPVIDNAIAANNPIPEPFQARAAARQALGDKRKPLPPDIQQLFPNSFIFNDDLGWIPESWEVRTTEEIATTVGMGPFGSNIKVETFVDEGVPIVNGQHLNETLLVEGKHNYITEDHAKRLQKSLAYAGDLVFTHRGTIGQVSLVPKSRNYEKFVVSQSQMFLRPNIEKTTSTFLIYFFRSPVGQHALLANASQVGVPSIARPSSHLKSIRLISPTKKCLAEFDSLCVRWLETLQANRSQIECLRCLRDTLLPKLLSGQIHIPDAEALVAEAI